MKSPHEVTETERILAGPASCTFYAKPFAVSGTESGPRGLEFKYRKLTGSGRLSRFLSALPYLWWVCK